VCGHALRRGNNANTKALRARGATKTIAGHPKRKVELGDTSEAASRAVECLDFQGMGSSSTAAQRPSKSSRENEKSRDMNEGRSNS
jgi:hypothetical protein